MTSEHAIARVLDLCDKWDELSKGESPTTQQLREAIGPVEIEKARNPHLVVDPQQMSLFGEPCD